MPTPSDRRELQERPAPTLPTPLSAALGLAAAYVEGVRRLPVTAVKVPVHAVGYALAVSDNLRREYEELADRGEAVLARLRGRAVAGGDQAGRAVGSLVETSRDAAEDLVESGRGAAEGARAGAGAGLRAAAEGVDAVADRVEDAAGQLAGAAAPSTPEPSPTSTPVDEDGPAEEPEVPEAEAPKGHATPEAPTARLTRRDSAAETSVRQEVESVTSALGGEDRVPEKDELPIPNFDHLSLAQVRGRLRRLSVEELVLLRNYERAHADRLPIVTMLDNRISKVADDTTPGGSSEIEPGISRSRSTTGGGAAGDPDRGDAGGAADSAGTGWPSSADGGAGAGAAGATGWPDTSGPGSAGGDGLASGGASVAGTTESAPGTPAGLDAVGEQG